MGGVVGFRYSTTTLPINCFWVVADQANSGLQLLPPAGTALPRHCWISAECSAAEAEVHRHAFFGAGRRYHKWKA